jgi:hypothetical protein
VEKAVDKFVGGVVSIRRPKTLRELFNSWTAFDGNIYLFVLSSHEPRNIFSWLIWPIDLTRRKYKKMLVDKSREFGFEATLPGALLSPRRVR